MNNNKKSMKYVLSALVILSFGTFIPTLAYAAPLADSARDWQYVNGNSWGQNYSPQTQITPKNVGDLEVKWIFPIGTRGQASTVLSSTLTTLAEGSSTPPLVVKGIVIAMSNWKRYYGLNASTGKQLWSRDYTVNVTDVRLRLPIVLTSTSHSHGIRYWESGNAILDKGLACDIFAIDATTGAEKFRINDLCKDVPGNIYKYSAGGLIGANEATNIGTYEKGRQFISVLASERHSGLAYPDGRHVTFGISMDAPYKVLWRVYSFPPQGVLTKDWALQECSIGFFMSNPCTDVAAKNLAGLEWDWALPNQAPSQWGGVTANWGQIVVDEETGLLYTSTGNQGPYPNVSLTPGPRLYGSTIMAIDMNKGQRAWWLQPFPHDPYDYDCNWGGVLADNPTLGRVFIKGCKEGILYVMDAKTGKPKLAVDVAKDELAMGQIKTLSARAHFTDPYSLYDLREWGWPDNGKYCGRPCVVQTSAFNGMFGTDISFDPETQTLVHYATAVMGRFNSGPYIPGGSVSQAVPAGTPATPPGSNTTVIARDLATGKVKWSWFYATGQQRSALVVAGSVVFAGFTDGNLRFFDKSTGSLVREMNMGSPLVSEFTTGQDSKGKQMVFGIVGIGTTALSPTQAGAIVGIGLSDRPAITTTTTTTATTTSVTTSSVTTTATTTSTTTATTTSVSTTTATTTSVSTATTSVTNTVTQPAVTSTLTETVGLPAEVTYGAVGIALVAIVAAAVMMTRKRA